jgi:hypothetical protein
MFLSCRIVLFFQKPRSQERAKIAFLPFLEKRKNAKKNFRYYAIFSPSLERDLIFVAYNGSSVSAASTRKLRFFANFQFLPTGSIERPLKMGF